jgi:hypothetical protein
MDSDTDLLLRTMQEGFRGVHRRLDNYAETVAAHGERLARLEATKQHRLSRPEGVDTKKFFVGMAGLTGILLVLYEIGQAVWDVIIRVRG